MWSLKYRKFSRYLHFLLAFRHSENYFFNVGAGLVPAMNKTITKDIKIRATTRVAPTVGDLPQAHKHFARFKLSILV